MSLNANNPIQPCLTEIIQKIPEIEQQLINIISQIQGQNGYISETDLQELANLSGEPESAMHGLVSFFDSFRTCPIGRNHLSVCYGTACYARGAGLIYDRLADELELDANDTSTDGFITLDKVQCVGACSLAPVISVNSKLEGRVKSHQMHSKLQELRDNDVTPE